MRLVLLGPPGAGKGTQAEALSKEYKLPHISTGDLLRAAVKNGTDVGMRAAAFMERGELVPDEIVIELVLERLRKPDAKRGFILDGFPRNEAQAVKLDEALDRLGAPIDFAINFDTSERTIISRLTGRRVCKNCGRNYHIVNIPPKREGVCDICGGELYAREDDKEETIKKRLVVYQRESRPLVEYYAARCKLKSVSGDSGIESVGFELAGFFKEAGIA